MGKLLKLDFEIFHKKRLQQLERNKKKIEDCVKLWLHLFANVTFVTGKKERNRKITEEKKKCDAVKVTCTLCTLHNVRDEQRTSRQFGCICLRHI